MMPNTLPVKIKISDLLQEKVRMRDFFTDYQMAVDSIGVIGEILGLNSSQYMTKSPQQVAEMVKTQAREVVMLSRAFDDSSLVAKKEQKRKAKKKTKKQKPKK